jgi:hypothetical protein
MSANFTLRSRISTAAPQFQQLFQHHTNVKSSGMGLAVDKA